MEESDNLDELEKLQQEIADIRQKIRETKDIIFGCYTLKRRSEISDTPNKNDTLPNLTSNSHNLELFLCNKIMKIQCKKNDSLITIQFPFKGECHFGLNLIRNNNNNWSLGNSVLPNSIDLNYYSEEINDLSLSQTAEFVEKIQKNIYAFYSREEQVKQLKEIIDPRIGFYHCLQYLDLEFKFKVYNIKEKHRQLIKVQINFDILSVEASKVKCEIVNDENEEMKNFLEENFKIFSKTDLVDAYNIAFTDNDTYKFFV